MGLCLPFLMNCGKNAAQLPSNHQITVEALKKSLDNPNQLLLDVRTPEEIEQGFIPGTDFFINFSESNFSSKLSSLDKGKTYVVVCRSGKRATAAHQLMKEKGIQSKVLVGGILQWDEPLEKK